MITTCPADAHIGRGYFKKGAVGNPFPTECQERRAPDLQSDHNPRKKPEWN